LISTYFVSCTELLYCFKATNCLSETISSSSTSATASTGEIYFAIILVGVPFMGVPFGVH
jgi:hypothetical protein